MSKLALQIVMGLLGIIPVATGLLGLPLRHSNSKLEQHSVDRFRRSIALQCMQITLND